MHGEAPPSFDEEEAGLAINTKQKMILCIDTYDILGHPRTLMAIPDSPRACICSSSCPYCSTSDIVIGFEETQYSVDEGDGTVTLNVVVLQGVVSGTVTLQVSTEDGSATCECTQSTYSLKLDPLTLHERP